MMVGTTGTIFQIERFSTHDGPGIRTTVFLKGCPLGCWWCHNPESQLFEPELMFRENRCIKCWSCVIACREGAISRSDNQVYLDPEKCNRCGDCVQVCASEAREFVGRRVTVPEVIAEIEKDIAFYDESGGGVTFSGGEPLAQPEFLLELLQGCKDRDIHTAVDTSGLTNWKTLDRVARRTDLFLYDLKLMDDARHIQSTGASNRLILQNLAALSALGRTVILRVPLIPGVNDDAENITEMAHFLSGLPLPPPIALLPYHKAGIHKYARLGRTYERPGIQAPSSERLIEIQEALRRHRLQVTGGGG